MAGAVQTFQPRELLIHTPDGKTRALQLDRERYTLGRSSVNELCYSEDAGLSRQHLVLERTGDGWSVRDLVQANPFVLRVDLQVPSALVNNFSCSPSSVCLVGFTLFEVSGVFPGHVVTSGGEAFGGVLYVNRL